MKTIGIGRLSTERTKQLRKLMNLSFSLHHLCILASPLPPTYSHFLNLRRQPRSSSISLSSIRMSSTNNGGSITSSTSDVTVAELESIFKQKRMIRSKVRKSLKEMDPSQRTLEGNGFLCGIHIQFLSNLIVCVFLKIFFVIVALILC